jgi:hypothetical protein
LGASREDEEVVAEELEESSFLLSECHGVAGSRYQQQYSS